jgi:hypothetical protein
LAVNPSQPQLRSDSRVLDVVIFAEEGESLFVGLAVDADD